MVQPQEKRPQTHVTLRPARPADAALLAGWRAEPTVARYQPLGQLSVAQLRAELANQDVSDLGRGRGEKFQWIVMADREAAGWITLVVTNWEHGLGEVGYALSTPFQRRGITPVALHDLLVELFLTSPLQRIEARCAIDNVGSRKVLEAVGFTREGVLRSYFELRGERMDNYLYAILRDDLLPPRPTSS